MDAALAQVLTSRADAAVTVILTELSLRVTDRITGQLMFNFFIKHVTFTCSPRGGDRDHDLFAFVIHDENLNLHHCHFVEVERGYGPLIARAIDGAVKVCGA